MREKIFGILVGTLFTAQAAGMSCERVLLPDYLREGSSLRIKKVSDLFPRDALIRPASNRVFFDPADTATLVQAALDIATEDSRILNLGTGSGLDSFVLGQKAAKVMGVDLSAESIAHAANHYQSEGVRFFQANYLNEGPIDLVRRWGQLRPDMVTANPPYVPCLGALRGGASQNMYGGPDGTRNLREVITYAEAMGVPKLALALGSYSDPLEILSLLHERGYRVLALTWTPLPFGKFSLANEGRILAQEKKGKAFLWRPARKARGYFVLGLSAVRENFSLTFTDLQSDSLRTMFARAEKSPTGNPFEGDPVGPEVPVTLLENDELTGRSRPLQANQNDPALKNTSTGS